MADQKTKYLLNVKMDVADEDDAILIAIIDEDTYKQLKDSKVYASMFQADSDEYDFDEVADVLPITDEEIRVLQKFGLDRVKAGAIHFRSSDSIELKLVQFNLLTKTEKILTFK